MRQLQAGVLALAAAGVGCCFLGSSDRDNSIASFSKPPVPVTEGEIVYLDVALIEQPYGNRFINQDVWELGDEQGITLEQKPPLEENGLRICQIGGLVPTQLQTLLSSPRSCPNPRRLRAEPGKTTAVLIGPPRRHCVFQLMGAAGSRHLDLEAAHCVLDVVPALEDESRVKLTFTPQVRYGNARLTPHVETDPNGPLRWAVEARTAVEEFPELHWECTVAANEYIILGTQPARLGTLGRSFFLPEGEPAQKQWLMVVRASRVLLGLPLDESLTQAPPLAMQASSSSVRGSSR